MQPILSLHFFAVLLLHGLNSDVSTWNALKDKEFNDKCTTLPLSGSIIVCQKVLIKTIMVIVRMIGKWLFKINLSALSDN
jgi:hypothetical protein